MWISVVMCQRSDAYYCICRFKVQQIPDIAASSRFGNSVTLYKMGDHIDISRGPMIAGTNLCWRFNVTAVSIYAYMPQAINDFGIQLKAEA